MMLVARDQQDDVLVTIGELTASGNFATVVTGSHPVDGKTGSGNHQSLQIDHGTTVLPQPTVTHRRVNALVGRLANDLML